MGDNEALQRWDAAAKTYREVQEQSAFAAQNRALVEQRFKEKVTGWQVLDAGCGYGRYTRWFQEQGAQAWGCDGSTAMLELARKDAPDCRFDEADLQAALPYEDGIFDLVFCNQVLMDLAEIEGTMHEFSRVIKPAGLLWLSIVHPAFFIGDWQRDENGIATSKLVQGYLRPRAQLNEFWGSSLHYHRPVSFYLNLAAESGFSLVRLTEPEAYDPAVNTSQLPLFLCAEFRRMPCSAAK